MPRPNRPRHIGNEAALAERIAFERESRGMTYDGLAVRMEKAGCPINASAIYKIEKGKPPRRITVDELVAFARVFELPIDELLLSANVVKNKKLRTGLDVLSDQFFALRTAQRDFDASIASLTAIAGELGFRLGLPVTSAADVDEAVVWIVDIKED